MIKLFKFAMLFAILCIFTHVAFSQNGRIRNNMIFCYTDGIFDGGADGADFTIGANSVSGRMTNNFEGLISGLAVFKKSLTEKDLKKIYKDADLLLPKSK